MASITKERGKYRAHIQINGHRESKSFLTKTEAKDWANRREQELKTDGGTAKIKFRDLAKLWVARYPRRTQIDWEAQRLDHLLTGWLGDTYLPKLDNVQVAKWRDERLEINQSSTVLRDWNLLSAVCSLASKEMGLLAKNPFSGVKRPEAPPPRDRLHTDAELKQLEAMALIRPSGAVALRVYRFASQTGMSAGECCALEWSQVNLATRVITLPPFKTRPARQVPLSKEALSLLGDAGEGSVFGTTTAKLDINWRKLCQAAGVDGLHFHDSRHAFCTWASKKIDAIALAKIMGHRDLRMILNVYYKEDAASLVNKLD